ncbi:MAG: FGGY family carbohydrate kinase, partial [Bacillota bacterium]
MKREYVIGLDLGTTSIKAVLFTTTGTPLKEAEEPVTTVHPSQIFAEQDPNEVEFKALKVLRDLLQELDIKQNTLVGI